VIRPGLFFPSAICNHPNIPPELPQLGLDHPLDFVPALGHIEQGFVVSGGILAADEKNRWARPDLSRPEDGTYFAAYAAQLANELDIPIALVGGLKSLEVVERLLAETPVDNFSMARGN
jgi:hypothetical protein